MDPDQSVNPDRFADPTRRRFGSVASGSGSSPQGGAGPKSAAELLGGILKSVQSKASRSQFRRALDDILGDQARHCQIAGFRGGTLWIEVASAPLFAELSAFRRDSLRLAMNERLDNQKIAKIVFRMDGTGHA